MGTGGGDRGVGRGGERARAGVYGLVIYYTLYRMDPQFFLVFFNSMDFLDSLESLEIPRVPGPATSRS